MDPKTLIPAPDYLLVPGYWFESLLILAFFLHLLFMNVMVGLSVISFFGKYTRKKSPSDPGIKHFEKDASIHLTIAFAIAINLGVATLLFVQILYGQFLYISSQLMAVYWISVIALVIVAYYLAYYNKFKYDNTIIDKQYLKATTMILLLIVGFFFVNNMTTMLTPDAWVAYFKNPAGSFINFKEPTLLPRYLHFMTASIAIGGLFVAIVWKLKKDASPEIASRNIEMGMSWFTMATLVQTAFGAWFLFSLPTDISALFLGKSALHTALLLWVVALAIIVLITGAYQKVWFTLPITVALVFSMVIVRDLVRKAYLDEYMNISDLKVLHQYSPLIVFLMITIISLGVCHIMIKWTKGTKTENITI